MGPVTYGVLLEFGFGYSEKHKRWRARQVVPPTWVLSSVEDASVQLAMREIGLLDSCRCCTNPISMSFQRGGIVQNFKEARLKQMK